MTGAGQCGDMPLVSIVTPSYNMGRYIEETIRSVLDQSYPLIEYIVMDGGSTDETLKIVERYKAKLRCDSSPDNGAADAINKALRMSSGEICAWLSADDAYLPNAIATVVEAFKEDSTIGVVYGEGLWTDASGSVLGRYPTSPQAVAEFGKECRICQPAVFIRRACMEQVGFLNSQLTSAFDYDLWVRLSSCTRFRHIKCELATSRMHGGNKTLGQRTTALMEAMRVQRTHFGYVPFTSVYAYCSWRIEGKGPFEDRHLRLLLPAALSFPVGLWINRSAPFRYAGNWGRAVNRGLSRFIRIGRWCRGDGA
jgi:glycosyltransferase involved in cell wall biosynthesis